MKYSILGFYQPAVLAIAKDVIVEQKSGEYPKTKTLKLDCIDLLILRDKLIEMYGVCAANAMD